MIPDRKQLRQQYKQTFLPKGIYALRNKVNGKRFIAASKNLNAAKNSIVFQLNNGMYPVAQLQRDWKELGSGNFEFEIIETIEEKNEEMDYDKELRVLEQLVLEALQPYGDNGYNAQRK